VGGHQNNLQWAETVSSSASVIAFICCLFTFYLIGPIQFEVVPNRKGSLQNISVLLTSTTQDPSSQKGVVTLIVSGDIAQLMGTR
jgi:hypothetical protein